jgi:hypothetical protein
MSLPMFLLNNSVVSNGDMSADITSSVVDVSEIKSIAVQASWSGSSPVGTLHIQASLDNVTYTNLTAGSSISGNTGSVVVNYPDYAFKYVRLFYDVTSGTGTLQCSIAGKGN